MRERAAACASDGSERGERWSSGGESVRGPVRVGEGDHPRRSEVIRASRAARRGRSVTRRRAIRAMTTRSLRRGRDARPTPTQPRARRQPRTRRARREVEQRVCEVSTSAARRHREHGENQRRHERQQRHDHLWSDLFPPERSAFTSESTSMPGTAANRPPRSSGVSSGSSVARDHDGGARSDSPVGQPPQEPSSASGAAPVFCYDPRSERREP